MARCWIVSILACALALPLVAHADPPTAPHLGGGIYLYSGDVPFLGGSTGAVVGLGYRMVGPLGKPGSSLGWNLSGQYGIGDYKNEVTTPTSSTTSESSLSNWDVRLGLDWWDDCCDEDGYCGPGLFYSSTGGKYKITGASDETLDPFKLYGLDFQAGGQRKLGGSLLGFGEFSDGIGYGSYDHKVTGTDDKITGWFNQRQFRAGIGYNYGKK